MLDETDLLITGATGQVGSALLRLFPQALAPSRSELDLARPESIRSYLRRYKPRWIVNPAAYTAVDRAESEPEIAYAINAEAPRILGEEAVRHGASVLHFSTDYVFDGAKHLPYLESDPANPLGVYGASKLAGEQALAATGAPHLILRTSWVYAATGRNFLVTILKMARERADAEPLRIVADQHGAPTSARSLAVLVAHLIARNLDLDRHGGIYHATSAGSTTWFGFASEALRLVQLLHPSARLAPLLPISTAEYLTPARRPLNSRLDCSRLAVDAGLSLPDWRESLAAAIAELPSGNPEPPSGRLS